MRIKYVPYQPHCFAFGGFELQMLSALAAVQKMGGDASTLDPWERKSDFDIVHCWGLGLPHQELIPWAKRSGKKVVITALLPYNEFLSEQIKFFISSYVRRNYFLIEMAKQVDAFTVLNDLQADICHRYYRVPENKIHIVPNIVHQNFYKINSDAALKEIFQKKYNITDFVFITGNVCSRKNHLSLIKACIKENLRLVIIGKPLLGEPQYIAEVTSLIQMNKNILWIKGLPENSLELVSAYANCSVFALPSYIESQPICLLEAATARKPLLIANRAYARQSYYTNAMLVSPSSVSEIAAGLKKILASPGNFIPPAQAIENCDEITVGNKYISVYRQAVEQ